MRKAASELRVVAWDNTTRFVVLFNAVANIMLGLSFLLWANTSAESVLSRYFNPHLWPALWILAGIVGLGGLWSVTLARFSFWLCGTVMFVFTLASLWAVVVDDKWVAVPTTVFLFYIGMLLICIAHLIRQRDNMLQQIVNSTMKGQETLDRIQGKDNE